MRVSERGRRSSSAVLIYVVILMAMQVFLVTVAAEAFLAGEAGLAWATAIVSVVLFAFAAGFLRYLRDGVPPNTSPEDGRMSVAVGCAATASLRKGRMMTVPPVPT